MYCVNFIFKNSPSALSFCFKAFKNADELRKKGESGMVENELCIISVEDDFGYMGKIDMSAVCAVTLGDIEKDLERQGQVQLLNLKASAKAQSLANNDAGLKMLAANTNSGIITQ